MSYSNYENMQKIGKDAYTSRDSVVLNEVDSGIQLRAENIVFSVKSKQAAGHTDGDSFLRDAKPVNRDLGSASDEKKAGKMSPGVVESGLVSGDSRTDKKSKENKLIQLNSKLQKKTIQKDRESQRLNRAMHIISSMKSMASGDLAQQKKSVNPDVLATTATRRSEAFESITHREVGKKNEAIDNRAEAVASMNAVLDDINVAQQKKGLTL
jgi:hypothetical protein